MFFHSKTNTKPGSSSLVPLFSWSFDSHITYISLHTSYDGQFRQTWKENIRDMLISLLTLHLIRASFSRTTGCVTSHMNILVTLRSGCLICHFAPRRLDLPNMDGDNSGRGLITPKKAALADLISPPLEDGRHAVQPHRGHVVDGDD